jgi:hypothetical protein
MGPDHESLQQATPYNPGSLAMKVFIVFTPLTHVSEPFSICKDEAGWICLTDHRRHRATTRAASGSDRAASFFNC